MSRLVELRDMLDETASTVARLEQAIASDPKSPSLFAMLKSVEKRRGNLEEEFLTETHSVGIDVCSYRLFGDFERPTIAAISKALGGFQTLVTVVYDAVKSSVPKLRARVGADIENETAFHFGYAFSGSLGVVLTIPNQRLLMGESDLDKTFRTIFNMAKAQNSSEILEFARVLGPAPVRMMYQWAFDHARHGLGVDIEWRRETHIQAKLFAQKQELENLYSTIESTSEETVTEAVVEGTLEGADVPRRSFHIVLDNGEDIRGLFLDAISNDQTVELPKRYRAILTKRSKIFYSTEREETSYFLNRLEGSPN